MDLALSEAALTAGSGDVPIGAVVLDADGQVIGTGRNRREECGDPTAHAEVLALREAAVPHALVEPLPGLGHMPQLEQPERIARLIDEFLAA